MPKFKNDNYILILFAILQAMPRNQKKQPIYCLEHQFSLAPIKSDVYFKQTASLSFCKGKLQSKIRTKCQNANIGDKNCSCCPVFNKDANYATSSFILPEQQQNFMENSKKLKLQHQHRVFDYNDQKSKMFIPKPKTKYSYCSACRSNYEDYLQHIKMDSHKNCASKSRFSHYIRELEKKYEKKIKVSIMAAKSFEGVSTNNQQHAEICPEELGRPNKKVKLSHQYPQQIQTQLLKSAIVQPLPLPLNPMNQFQLPYPMPISFPMPPNPSLAASPNMFYPSYPFHQLELANLLNNPYYYWNNYGFNPSLYNLNLNMDLNLNNQSHSAYMNSLDAYINLGMNLGNNQAGYATIGNTHNRPIVIDLEDQNNS